MEWSGAESGDVAFADDVLERERVIEVPPAGRVIRRGGAYELEDIQPIPSFPELLHAVAELGIDLTDPDVAGLIPEDDVIAFGITHAIDIENTLRLYRKQEPYKIWIKKGHLQTMRLHLSLYNEGDPILKEVGIPLPVAELHAPWRDGCQASYEVEKEKSAKAGLNLRMRGVGAGGGIQAKLKFRDKIWTEAECGQVTIPGNIEVVPWHNPDDDKTIEVVSVTNISAGEWSLVEIPTGRKHLCSNRFEEVVAQYTDQAHRGWRRPGSDHWRHKVDVSGGISRSRTVEASREFSFDFGSLVEVKSQFTSSYTYAFSISGNAEYIGFFEKDGSETFFWVWRSTNSAE